MYGDVAGKKLLLIGSDSGNVHIIDQARKMGVYTIAIDWEKDHSKCPAKQAADEAWDMSYRDVDAVAERCRKEKVEGVLAGYSEYRVLMAARIAEKIGSPFYVTPEQVELTRNKRSFKELCRTYGVPVPADYCATGVMTEAEKAAMRYPVIVKPSDCGGRIGVSVCRTPEELEPALEEALRNSESKTVVAEEYITGRELSAIYTMADGTVSLSLINDKYMSREGPKYSTLCELALTPSKYCERYRKTVDGQVRALLKGIGMRDGVAFFQMIVNDEKIVVFEMGLRMNGGNDWKIISRYNGINQCEMLIRHSLTGTMGGGLDRDNPLFPEYVCTFLLYTHGGEVGEVDYSALRTHGKIFDAHPYLAAGKVMPDKGTTQQRAFSIKFAAKDRQELADTIRFIQQSVTVRDVNGRNMLFRPFDLKRLESL